MKFLDLSLNCEHGVAQDLEPGTRGVLSPLTLRPFPGLGSWPPGAWAVPVQSRQELTGFHGGEEVLLLPSPFFWEGPDVGPGWAMSGTCLGVSGWDQHHLVLWPIPFQVRVRPGRRLQSLRVGGLLWFEQRASWEGKIDSQISWRLCFHCALNLANYVVT